MVYLPTAIFNLINLLLTLKNYIMNNKINFGINYQYGYALFNLRVKLSKDDADRIKLAHTGTNYYLGYNDKHGHYKLEGIMPSTAFHALYDDLQEAMDAYKIETIRLKSRYRKTWDCSYQGSALGLRNMMDDDDLPF